MSFVNHPPTPFAARKFAEGDPSGAALRHCRHSIRGVRGRLSEAGRPVVAVCRVVVGGRFGALRVLSMGSPGGVFAPAATGDALAVSGRRRRRDPSLREATEETAARARNRSRIPPQERRISDAGAPAG